jgi:hypothetical protein
MSFGWLLQLVANPSPSPINVTVTAPESGWSIFAAIAQGIAAVAIVVTLVIFALQLRTMRGQGQTAQAQLEELRRQGESARRKAVEDRHSAVTPMLWITVEELTSAQGSPNVEGYFFLHVDGTGFAFAVSPALTFEDPTEAAPMAFQMPHGPYTISAPSVEKIPVRWTVPAHPVTANLEVNFDNVYNRRVVWRQDVRILPEKRIALVGAPDRQSLDPP